MATWVNFQELRDALDFERLLSDYGVEYTVKGEQATAFCPLPGHKSRSERKSRSFSVNLSKGIFQCFGCQSKGNVLEFGILMEGLDPSDKAQFRKGALALKKRYLGEKETEERPGKATAAETSEEVPAEETTECVVNAPLEFELKSIDPKHPYLTGRGLTAETIAHFGAGYCSRGLMKGRAVIPLHDQTGQLIGYAGRLVEDAAIDADTPKYLLPGARVKDGVRHEFHKSEFVFNGHRIGHAHPDGVDSLAVVEGFFGAMRVHQAGIPVVALMGATCSEAQARLLLRLTRRHGRIFVMPDGDEAGVKCALSVVDQICGDRMVRWVRLSHKQEPDTMGEESIQRKLADSGF